MQCVFFVCFFFVCLFVCLFVFCCCFFFVFFFFGGGGGVGGGGGIFLFIIPHVNSPYKTSIDEQLIFYNITRCYSSGEHRHPFAIAAGDIIKYQRGHMMRNADAHTVRSRQETFNSNDGHEAWFCDFQLPITSLFMVRNIKCGYSFS